MASPDAPCYTVVFESSSETPSVSDLRAGLEKGSDEVKIETLRKIIISTINGNPQARLFSAFWSLRLTLGLYCCVIYTATLEWISMNTANSDDAHHPICPAIQEQAAQETASFLLGSMSQVRRQWEAEAGDDPCRVSLTVIMDLTWYADLIPTVTLSVMTSYAIPFHKDSPQSNAIRTSNTLTNILEAQLFVSCKKSPKTRSS